MLFMSSCSTEELNNEVTPENPAAKTNNRISAAKFAGDGIYDVLGHGFDAAGEYANANSAGFKVIDIDRFKAEQPGRLISENTNAQEYVEEYGENAESYSKMVSTKITATAGIPLFKKTLSVAFNSAVTNTNKFDAKYIYGSYNLTIKQKRIRFNSTVDALGDYLTPEFTQDLQTKSPQQIVNDYGTHVMLDIYTGAKMDILFQSETSNQNREHAARVGIKVGMKDIFDVDVTNDVNTSSSNQNFSKKLSYKTRGGDPSKGLMNDLNLDQNNPKISISAWQNSSTPSNSVLVDFGSNGLILIYDLVKDAVKKAQLKAYVDQYLIDNKVYLQHNTVPVYSYYSSKYNDHYYNTSNVTPNYYVNEGAVFNVLNYKAAGAVPVYGYYSSKYNDHYYNTSAVTPNYYINEGVFFYAYTYQAPGTVPVYGFYSGKYQDHYLSKSPATPNYYVNEGIMFYAY